MVRTSFRMSGELVRHAKPARGPVAQGRAALSSTASGCRNKGGTVMSTKENKALVRRFYAEIDKGNLAAMDELVAEDYLDHNPAPFPGLRPGRDGLKQA